jgi:hypothetical protein
MTAARILGFLLVLFAPSFAAAQAASPPASDGARTDRVKVEYEAPTNAAHQPILDLMKERHVLERIQKLLSPIRLSRDLTLKVKGCGMNNAWYENGVITVCYEYLDNVRKNLPKETSKDGVTPNDALAAETYFVFLHETGHAMFDLLNVPVFGNEESAADQFASYILLQMGKDDARQLVLGATYTFRPYMNAATTTESTVGFSDIHGTPAQRFFNLLCIGFGARQDVFGDLVKSGLLPQSRAQDCPFEYGSLAFAVGQLVKPYIDQQLAQQVLDQSWLPPVNARPKRPSPPPQ